MTRLVVVDGHTPDPAVLADAAAALARGDLLVYPTETLYALGGVAKAEVAGRVRDAKGRDDEKPLPLIAASLEQVLTLCERWPEVAALLAARFWPGPLTLVLAARAGLAREITAGRGSVAVRVPGLRLARALCEGVGPLVSTSANRSGESPQRDCGPAVTAVGEHVALALDAGRLFGVASTIVDLTGEEPRLLRAGAVSVDQLGGALREAGARLQTGPGKRTAPP